MLPLSVLGSIFMPLFVFIVIVLIFLLMRPRRFYLIRHGETQLNAQHIRQGEDGALSEKGREQAAQVGKYLARFPIGLIVTSTYPRAQETAAILKSYLKAPVVSSPLLVERRNPSEIVGKKRDDPEIKKITESIDDAYHEDTYRYSDEETFAEMKKRGRKCLALLTLQGAHETAVVTHHQFLKMLIAYMLYRERLHAGDFIKVSFFNYSDNAGITICEYHPWKMFNATRGWEVVSYNEKAIDA